MRPLFALVFVLLSAHTARSEDAVKIGTRVDKLKFTDTRSLPRTSADFGTKKALVFVFTNTTCPVVQRYLPTLQALETEYRPKGVQFVAVNAADEDTLIAIATQSVKYDVEFPFVKDFDGSVARALGVKRTPEVVVLDADHAIRYRGRIDDQYRLRGNRAKPTTHELKDALDAVLAGQKVATPETEVDGCPITFPKSTKPKNVNFAEHVAPILRKHCAECHKAGGSAPFALTTYKQASARAAAIAEVVRDQRMPPWFAIHDFGPFVNRRGLSDDERTVLTDWARTDAAPGDLTKVPAPPSESKDKWLIGKPDLVLESTNFELPTKGDIPYKYAILLHNFTEDTWVQGVQITSDNPRVLHHANLAFGSLASGFKEENFVTGYVPGGEPMNLDSGVAFRIPKGSILALQIHFVSTGKEEKCRLSVGLRYPRNVVQQQLRNIQLTDSKFAIPPGAPAHKVTARRVLDTDVVGVGLFAHMHLRGKDMTFTAHAPDGTRDPLLVVANYNFSWQVPYRWEPGKKVLPKGTRLECVARYDNSAFNPYNPDPQATVRNGPQTRHEMMFGFFFYTNANEKLNLRINPETGTEVKEKTR
ncbi:thiol-disulfide oxidoreductase : Thiol-disulfide isomerase-like thioredoxin OS=Singulisphaera acidiphila (strain ATCC BAA-1392 / DSM 18658 / VKM B-2454 / MOB10) GN=Sinac_2770 PE=4 SV=1: Redoxin: Cu2_monoox_C [Gemmata massiliana]|uniref:Thioredoxin domain-containing protein n=1 Tax=Gemmata massiliana TaxID=1210884 RepID=A0A6P2CSZ6_9BACT|nr:redoxin family protein [Gemmata massiliana]VTR91737.1 thiol-disulfide oxidoreductase : Thiol-disulfide isomerase-like thioredoxin OS=Singulisphaera acidiphila (strain ATCC BAA-1392 / DSM 18658 / VKM B-2454 / MOB10) GN=Sinac_2770 PE=4 SV=1: Redoxin: Cu2_monoox_C [Gemmata massiliana]